MHVPSSGSIAGVVAIVAGFACADPLALAAGLPTGWPVRDRGSLVRRASDSGIDIVRMPPKAREASQPGPGAPGAQSQPAHAKPQGRLFKLTVKLGSQPFDIQKGWLGIRLEPLESVLATSLGL